MPARKAKRPTGTKTTKAAAKAGPKPAAKPATKPAAKPLGSAPLPAFIEPQLATLADRVPNGDEWLHELKFDGYRILARVEDKQVTLHSRRENDWTARFAPVAKAVAALPVRAALLDGEVAVMMPDGRTSFQALQNALSGTANEGLCYLVFDLLHLDGEDLRPLPLETRKQRLAALLASAKQKRLRYSDHVIGQGDAFFETVCGKGLEGVVSKRRDLPHHAGRSPSWIKTKCLSEQEMVIGGFTEPEGTRAGLGALHVGHYQDGKLHYGGKVGTGFTQKSALALRQRLQALEQAKAPFVDPPRGAMAGRVVWVKPTLVAQISFGEWTSDGKLRHPVFKGLREDKAPTEVRRERPQDAAPQAPQKAALAGPLSGPPLTHPDRVLWPAEGFTKADLARYYEAVAPHLLPYIAGRPLTLVRCPQGISGTCFFVKHAQKGFPKELRTVDVEESGKTSPYVIADDVAALVALAQMSVIELHTWNAVEDDVDTANRIVLDLDPGPDVAFPQVVEAAQLLRAGLQVLRLQSFVKTTGGKGLHVVVPLSPGASNDEAYEFARAFAETIARERPQDFTATMAKRGREKKILIDYMRNHRAHTSVAELSPRARPGAGVATPLHWDELAPTLKPADFTITTVPQRLKSLGADPWAAYTRTRQRLPG